MVALPQIKPGALVPTAYAAMTSEVPGEVVAAAVGWARPVDPRKNGVIMEFHDKATRDEAERMIVQMLEEAFRVRGETIRDMQVFAAEHTGRADRLRPGRHHAPRRRRSRLVSRGLRPPATWDARAPWLSRIRLILTGPSAVVDGSRRASSPATPPWPTPASSSSASPSRAASTCGTAPTTGPASSGWPPTPSRPTRPALDRDLEDLAIADLGDCELGDGTPREQLDPRPPGDRGVLATRGCCPSCSAATTRPRCR